MEKIITPTKIDVFIPLSQRIPLWRDLGLLKWDKTIITSNLDSILEKIAIIVENYDINCSNIAISNLNFDLVPRSFERIVRSLSKGFNLFKTLFDANGWYGKVGLEYASSRLLKYSKDHAISKRTDIVIPIATEFPSIINSLYNQKNWHEYNIMTWNDLLRYTFGAVNVDRNLSLSDITFDYSKKKLVEIYEESGRLPKLRDSNITNAIGKACQKGNFIDRGISSWNDFLRLIFGIVNNDYDIYSGVGGFENAKKFLINFQDKYGRIPTLKDRGMDSLLKPIKDGKWEHKGIASWNELLEFVFGELNHISRNTYRGRQGLENAKRFLLKFKKSKHRLPTVNDSGMPSIASLAYSKEWGSHNIFSWNDLVLFVFGKNNSTIRKKFVGLKGLDEAAEDLREFKEKYNRLPRYKGDGMGSIISAMHRGEWKSVSITKWNELLLTVFGKINIVMNKYVGKRGLEIAKHEVTKFQKFFNRNPKTKDIGMAGIARAIWRGEWKEFGINSIQDLW